MAGQSGGLFLCLVLLSAGAAGEEEATKTEAPVGAQASAGSPGAAESSESAESSSSSGEAPTKKESGEQLLARANSAFQAVNLARAQDFAQQALRTGELTLAQLSQAYRIIGDCYAILDQKDAARQTYLRLLAVAPRSVVSQELNPEMQVPFVEARSHWNRSGPGLQISLQQQDTTLVVSLVDPLELVSHVDFQAEGHANPQKELSRKDFPYRFPIPENDGEVQYFLTARDLPGNVVHEQGRLDAPLSLAIKTPEAPPADLGKGEPERSAAEAGAEKDAAKKKSLLRSPVFWGVVGMVAAGVIVAVAVSQHSPERDFNISVQY